MGSRSGCPFVRVTVSSHFGFFLLSPGLEGRFRVCRDPALSLSLSPAVSCGLGLLGSAWPTWAINHAKQSARLSLLMGTKNRQGTHRSCRTGGRAHGTSSDRGRV